MGSRRQVLDALQDLSFGAELLGDRRARSYGTAWWNLRQVSGDLGEMAQSGELIELKGIGKSTVAVVKQVYAGVEPTALQELKRKLPVGLFELRRLKGLGAKKVKRLWNDLGITTLAELEYACRENRLVKLDGFGAKTQKDFLEQIGLMRSRVGKLRRDVAKSVIQLAVATLEATPSVERVEIVGDYRCGKELVDGVELLIAGDPAGVSLDERVRLHRSSLEGFGWATLRLSASEKHVQQLAARAHQRGVEVEDCDDEADVYSILDLHFAPPERRDEGVPLVEIGRAVPRLVCRRDLRGALHNHTTASDGSATLEEMRAAAERVGLEYLGITDHSVTATYARGLNAERLAEQCRQVALLNGQLSSSESRPPKAANPGCVLLTGVGKRHPQGWSLGLRRRGARRARCCGRISPSTTTQGARGRDTANGGRSITPDDHGGGAPDRATVAWPPADGF